MVLIFPKGLECSFGFQIQIIPHAKNASFCVVLHCFLFSPLKTSVMLSSSFIFPPHYGTLPPLTASALPHPSIFAAFISGRFYLFSIVFSCCLIMCLQEFCFTVLIFLKGEIRLSLMSLSHTTVSSEAETLFYSFECVLGGGMPSSCLSPISWMFPFPTAHRL